MFGRRPSTVLALATLLLLARTASAQPAANPAGLLVAPVGSATNLDVGATFQPFGDAESVALGQLARAQKSVHIAHYNIRNTRFHDALAALRARGVSVQIATDAKEAAQPWNWLTGQFKSEGFDLITFQPPTSANAIMHLKACVIDGETVLTGSYNWNNTAQLSNDENMLVIHDRSVAAEYDRFIDSIRANKILTWKPQLAAGSPIEVHFSPADRPDKTITKLIDAAKTRITVSMFTFTDRYAQDALVRAVKRGVPVDLVTEAKQAGLAPVTSTLMTAGARVIVGANTGSAFSAMHHKYAVIDDTVVTGACNWTKTAFLESCEDVVVVRDAGLARTYRANWKALAKRYAPFTYDPYLFGIATPESHVQFVAKHDRTAWGDRVVVVGNHPALGNWDPRQGLELRTADDVYPKWSASATLPAGVPVEYKYVTLTAAGDVFWEEGANRSFTVDAQGIDEARSEDYRFPAPALPAAPSSP